MIFSDLQAAVSGLINRRDPGVAAQIPVWIQNGLLKIQRELRCPAMEKTVLATIDTNYTTNGGLIIPNDMIELIRLENSDGARITKEDSTTVNLLAMSTSPKPRYYYRQGGIWVLGPAPTANDTIKIEYYAELGALVNPGDSNPITVIAPDMCQYAALIESGRFFTDRRLPEWKLAYQEILTDLQAQADDDELSGGAVVSASFAYPEPLDDI